MEVYLLSSTWTNGRVYAVREEAEGVLTKKSCITLAAYHSKFKLNEENVIYMVEHSWVNTQSLEVGLSVISNK